MPSWELVAISIVAMLALYAGGVLALVAAGRRTEAVAVARFVPDCAVLSGRLIADSRVPRSRKLILAALALYLASPIDLVPDFIPVAGALDDVILIGVALRVLLDGTDAGVVRDHWPGPAGSLEVLLRVGGVRLA